jgi:hypothetical protein
MSEGRAVEAFAREASRVDISEFLSSRVCGENKTQEIKEE